VGSRRHVALGVAGIAGLFVVPLLALGGASYPAGEWRRAIAWTIVAGLVGFWVHDLAQKLRDRGKRFKAEADRLLAVERMAADGIERSPIGIATTDLAGRFLTVNDALVRFLGRPRGELVGRSAPELSHADHREETIRALRRIADDEIDSHTEEQRYVLPDGAVVWALLSIGAVRGSSGAPDHLLVHFGDLTAQKRAEHDVRDREDDLRAVARVAHELAMAQDVRAVVCAAALDVAGATASFVWEPNGRDELEVTAWAGAEPPVMTLPLSQPEPSGTLRAYHTASRLLVEDARNDPRISRHLAHIAGAESVLFEPIIRRGATVGVILVVWDHPIGVNRRRAVEAVGLLASEAAIAFEREELVRALEELARVDPLTGVANRRTWNEYVPAALDENARHERPCAAAVLDLDHFKTYNDSNGHQAGDELLQTLAQHWQAHLRPGDLLARYGGEEFVVLLPGCDRAGALQVLERLARSVPARQTCSIGYAVWDGRESSDSLVRRADLALYEAKAAGRASIQFAGPVAVPHELDAAS